MSFGVDTDAMQRSAGQIGAAAEQLDALLSKMRTDVNEMLSGWSGAGASAHRDLHARYEADVVAINKNLRQMQAALQRTHGLYVNQENEQSGDHVAMRTTINS
ncbi:WXG100 family type VII secretion target [uncultured Jatrophihabitans sp.]|uniref:WXG100 family type VII secretion target n=1 Tax=uncultured Jatrophihabitans sp. TaxID=1610747 RepID=UPI0035C9C05B